MEMPASRTMPALIDELVARYPDRNFLTDGDRRLSYREFRAESRRLARGFHALGVRRGDKVALVMGNQLEWLLVDFAVTMLGGVLVALNTWWRRTELQHALAISESSVLVMVDRYLSSDYTAVIAEIDRAADLPGLRHLVCLGDDAPAGALPFARLWAMGADVPEAVIDDAAEAVQPDDLAYLVFTLGIDGPFQGGWAGASRADREYAWHWRADASDVRRPAADVYLPVLELYVRQRPVRGDDARRFDRVAETGSTRASRSGRSRPSDARAFIPSRTLRSRCTRTPTGRNVI